MQQERQAILKGLLIQAGEVSLAPERTFRGCWERDREEAVAEPDTMKCLQLSFRNVSKSPDPMESREQ